MCVGSELMLIIYDLLGDILKIGFIFNNFIYGG